MTDPRVRRISFVTGGMTCWSGLIVWLAAEGLTPWFLAGIVIGLTIGIWFMLFSAIDITRRRLAAEDRVHAAAAFLAKELSEELARRGDGFEAVLAPGERVVIHRRGLAPTSARLH